MKIARLFEKLQTLEALPGISKLPLSSKEKQLVGIAFFFIATFLIAYITVLLTWKSDIPQKSNNAISKIEVDTTGPVTNSEAIEAFKNSANFYLEKDSLYEAGSYIEKFLNADSTEYLYPQDTIMTYKVKLTKILQELGLREDAHLRLSELISQHPEDLQLACIELENTPDEELTPLTEEPRFQNYVVDEKYLSLFIHRYIEIEPEKSKAYIDALIKLNKTHSDISFFLSKYYANSPTSGDAEKALVAIKDAVKRNPLNGLYRSELGYQLFLKEEYDASLKELQIAIQLMPDNPTTHFNLGQLYQKIYKEPERAAVHYEKALSVKTDHWRSHFELGLVYLQLNKIDKAVAYLTNAEQLKPKDLRIFLQLAAAYERAQNTSRAFDYYYDSILTLDKTNEIALYKLTLPTFTKLRAERDLNTISLLLDSVQDTSTSIAILNGILGYDKYNVEALELLDTLSK